MARALPMRKKQSEAWHLATRIGHELRMLDVDALVTDIAVARNFKSTGLKSADDLFQYLEREMALLVVLAREFQSRSMNSQQIRERENEMLAQVFADLLLSS